ncbi:OmpH family outer membrane protein [Desulfobacca acetoxidans]|uniref:Outer membrane chaperone Skp (OmpH) n=1 Tax=Desulfobacca acetoxidans (strain ATCC 700848 / DSM 11109 / ASRB2) TaxID=880072 RepID=F2NIQ7_DESAR|nr:OmpH family outer membrane protein [Desulfobacca acetoxidans]AEB10532.1 outer membrane chaperone Skp (OmpH) [Desulfobacca acetoxidans DSM 11109]HAY23330.1 OmpH family outer membrane protein [Desulfobacterales bacterium]
MKLKVFQLCTTLVLILSFAAAAPAADVKVAVVDMADVIFNSSEGKRAQESIKRKGEELGRDLERRRTDFGRQVEEYQKQAAVMKDDARKRKEEEFGRKEAELRQKVGSSQQEMAKLEEKELKPLYDKFKRVIEQISKEGKYSLILDKRVVIGFDPSVDITEKVKDAFGR